MSDIVIKAENLGKKYVIGHQAERGGHSTLMRMVSGMTNRAEFVQQPDPSKGMQLVAGRTGQEYNGRKKRKGAYWEDRYHATAVESGEHLLRCIVYIDLNMVRAGVVKHPSQWKFGGFNEIQKPMRKCALIVGERLCELLNFSTYDGLVSAHRQWVEEAIRSSSCGRAGKWTQSIAVGSKGFIEQTMERLGIRAKGRKVLSDAAGYHLREQGAEYVSHFDAKNSVIGVKNAYYWNISDDISTPQRGPTPTATGQPQPDPTGSYRPYLYS